jgi:hypothetical protein
MLSRWTALAVLTCSLIAATAQAYLPHTEFLLGQMADRRKRTEVRDLTVLLTADLAELDAPVEERIYLKNPERLRLERESGDGTKVLVDREGKRAQGTPEALKRVTGGATDLLAQLLMPKGADTETMAARVLAALQALGVDTKVVALTIYGADVRESAYVIGAHPWETDKPQVWLDSSTFLPVRVITLDAQKTRQETRYLDYGSSGTGDWFPRVIESYAGSKLVRRAEVSEIKANQDLPDTLFQLPAS